MVNALVLTGHGINCDLETADAFERAGADATIVHVEDLSHNDLISSQILAFPGGFSHGDDTGAGNALANDLRNRLHDEIYTFADDLDKLMIGICNGFQVMANLGLLPATSGGYGKQQVALVHNDSARYIDRWVDVTFSGTSPWVRGLDQMPVPIAHGEGKFYAPPSVLGAIEQGYVAMRYSMGDVCADQNLAANPNGSLENIAGVTDSTGRLIGMMPHPERAINFTHLPNWPLLKETYKRAGKEMPEEGPGLQIFRNGVDYFK